MIKYYFDSIDSTNDMAKKLLKIKVKNFAVIANEQTSGRGHLGTLFSHEHTELYLSVALKLKADLNNSFIAQASAVAVCRAIETLYGLNLDINNENDLFLDGKKVGSIIVETFKSFLSKKYFALFGIKLNLYKPVDEFSIKISRKAGYLFDSKINKNKLSNEIIKQIQTISKDYNSKKINEEYYKRKG